MIRIGDFSKLAHVTVKTLRHYGELGLLQPAHIDRYTGYRYYTLDQLGHLNRILAFKELGFSLDQVTQLMDEELSIEEMRGMLRMKQMELTQSVAKEQARLDSVQDRLHHLAQEECIPFQEIAIKEVPSHTALSAKVIAATEDAIRPARYSLQKLLFNYLERARLKPTSPWFALVNNAPYADNDLEVELAVGVQLRIGQHGNDWNNSPIHLLELPATKSMASVVHDGRTTHLTSTYAQLYGWMQANGFQVAGSFREIYLPDSGFSNQLQIDLDAGFTELQCPVKRASIPISIQSTQERKEQSMQPKIITKPAFKSVGMSYVGLNQAGEIPKMWNVYNRRINEVAAINDICFGLCFSSIKGTSEGEFEYVASTEVKDDKNIPKGMVYREVPEYKYAVFTHNGKLDRLGETYEYIYKTWLPQSGYELHPDKYDMEVYDDRFTPDSEDSAFDIYVALK
ncbi:GyrI-like domain-containing protein [Chloroflexota bacterium]